MAIPVKIVHDLDSALESVGMYGSNEIEFLVVDGTNLIDSYTTHCKEELGADCVRDAVNTFLVVLPDPISDSGVKKILDKIHAFEKSVKAPLTKIARVKGYGPIDYDNYDRELEPKIEIQQNILYITHGRRWSRNSAAHAVYSTHLRKYIVEVTGHKGAQDDDKHIKQAKWLIDMLKIHGVTLFKNIQHEGYDVGMISLMKNLEVSSGCLHPVFDNKDIPPQPSLSKFGGDMNAYYKAYDDWYDEYGHMEDDFYEVYGDLDERIPDNHGYGKIEKLYVKDFVKSKKKVKK
jgi:hypothetical protein